MFPFNSELCGVRCGAHSTIRGVHTWFTPIDVQHAATEGHLGRREGRGRGGGGEEAERVRPGGNAFTLHTHGCLSHFDKSPDPKSCLRLLCGFVLSTRGNCERSEPCRVGRRSQGLQLCGHMSATAGQGKPSAWVMNCCRALGRLLLSQHKELKTT